MSLYIYTPDFSNFHEIKHAVSIQYSGNYNAVGKFTLVVPDNDYNAAIIKDDSLLYDTEKRIAFIVKNVKIDTKQHQITANGFTTNWLLKKRVIASPVTVSNAESGVYSLVNDNLRGLTRIATAASKGLTEVAGIPLNGGYLLDGIETVLSSVALGNRMAWNPRTLQHTFEVYKGEDKTTGNHAVVFSDERGTARNLVITEDASEFKNVIYAVAEYNDTEIVEVIGTATGDERHEIWASVSVSKDRADTESTFRAKMRTAGALELSKYIKRLSFKVSIDPTEFGKAYSLGDVVSCVSNRYGIKFNARVTSVQYKKDSKTESTEITLGDPILISIGEVKLSG
jgi:hypothetical protein